jgi:hypothetical protein
VSARSTAAELLGVAAIAEDGLLVREDGALVRCLEVGWVNPLAMDGAEAERISAAFAQLSARLADRQSMQLYVEGTPLVLADVLSEEGYLCEQAAGAAEEAGEPERAAAIRRLGIAQEQSLRSGAEAVAPVRLRYLVICPSAPARALHFPPARGRARRVKAEAYERAGHELLRHVEGVRSELEAMGVAAGLLDGAGLLDLLQARFDPDASQAGALAPSFMHAETLGAPRWGEGAEDASARASALAEAICTVDVDRSPRSHMRVGAAAVQSFCVSLTPEQTWLGWLLHMVQAPRPFVLSVHVQATERYRERMAQKRRYRRIHGVNRGVEMRGRPLDPDARLQEEEAAELNDELASSAGSGIYRVSIYCSLTEHGPEPDTEALSEICQSGAREVSMSCDAHVDLGAFSQCSLWRSTLPLGRDIAQRKRKYVSANVGDTFPLCGTSCTSPGGIPLGYAVPGRTLERLDPFDPAHPNHLMVLNGMSGAGKTMLAILLLLRLLLKGARGFVIDRAGHFDFACGLMPGAVSVEFGAGAHAINSWDVPDPAQAGAEKVDYLLALHAQLLGEHQEARDSYGLSDLEANLLGLAIGEVYARCALTGEEPRELLLQEELDRRYEQEREEGSIGIAEALRNLSMRLNNYVGDGPYAYLTDRPTTIPADSPLVVFDTRSIPESKAAAAMFVICEYVKAQIERIRAAHLQGRGPRHDWAGRTVLMIDEGWKMIQRPATGRWFNEFARRSRHLACFVAAISQQLSDFDCEDGRALLANASMQIHLRQLARELGYFSEKKLLGEEAIGTISTLPMSKGSFTTAYVVNGTRVDATVRIGVGSMERWIASNDPPRDLPIRWLAIRQTEGEFRASGKARWYWAAMRLLVDEAWQARVAESHLGGAQ